jgi:16S rRNA (cytosine1402-N4)-methyltransferase
VEIEKLKVTTAETYHVSVLLRESVDGLVLQPDGIYVDATFGGGGHSKEILRRLSPQGRLFGFDQDADAEQNIVNDDRFTFVRSNFRYMRNWMRYHKVEGLDGVLADLGVSSHHFDDADRGFSFRFDSPLDMRMNRRAGITAADVVNDYDEQRLSDIFYLYGELKNARRLAAAIVKARQKGRIETTGQLLQAVAPPSFPEGGTIVTSKTIEAPSGAVGGASGAWKKDAAKLFQALRIEVNHEMDALRDLLQAATELLKPGGRLSVITYHSLEDRIVKNVMRSGNAEGQVEKDFFGRVSSPLHIINNKVVTPSEEELAANPRSRSAKLRVAEKKELEGVRRS